MRTRIHAMTGLLAMLAIVFFWSSTLISELFLSVQAVVQVKQGILFGLAVLIPLLMITGGSGFALSIHNTTHPLIKRKRRRMPFIGLNGLLILLPSAFYLSWKAQAGQFDGWFYGVQILELFAGLVNLFLMGLSAYEGVKLRKAGKISGMNGLA